MTVLIHQGESIAVTVQSFPAGASDGGRRPIVELNALSP
jgi:hypothetical protein